MGDIGSYSCPCGMRLHNVDLLNIVNHKKQCKYANIKNAVTPQRMSAKTTSKLKSLRRKIKKLTEENKRLKNRLKKRSTTYVPHVFYDSSAWRELRYEALKRYGRKCACCGDTTSRLHVDHIQPRSLKPELQFDINNLQVLCEACNLGKGNRDSIKWGDR